MLHPSKSVELSRKIPFPTITNPEQIKWVKKCVNEELIEEAKIKGWRYRPENDYNFC